MKVHKFDSRDEWFKARKGRITGSKVRDIITKRGNGKKVGFYQLIADRVAIDPDEENPMERGQRLEETALKQFSEVTKKEVDTSLVLWTRDDLPHIGYSPDGVISDTEVVEVKCLKSALHIKAYLTQEVPAEYFDQVTQAFVVNDNLKKLYLVFYDDRLISKQFFFLTVTRSQVKAEEYLEIQKGIMKEVEKQVGLLDTF